jgi:hydroxymethylbilane synthase
VKLRIGTRGSALARAQAADVARRLEAHGHSTKTIIISTEGDRVTDRGFTDVGAFGIFVREIEAALLDRRVDVAVHSYKDMPSRSPDGLVIAAVPERVDAADVLLTRPDATAAERGTLSLRDGARVGTSAARRQALLRSLRPDLEIGMLRGNVPTRVHALSDGRFDAIVLAAAGLARLERAAEGATLLVPRDVVRTRLDPATFVPAPAQGAVAVQVRAQASAVRDAVAAIDDARTARALRAERAALAFADGGCTLPFGAWCEAQPDGALRLIVALGRSDGTVTRAEVSGDDPDALAEAAWREVSSEVRA